MTGIETTVVTAITNAFISQIMKSGWEGVRPNELLKKDVGEIISDKKYLFFKQYITNYWKRHGLVKVLDMAKPMNLESIYINVKCLDSFARDAYADPRSLEESWAKNNRRFLYKENEKKDGLFFANKEQYLMVFGGPGIGKSTFLRKVGLESLKGNQSNYKHNLTPVLLELKNFKEEEIDIQKLIEEEFENCKFPNVHQNITRKLAKGELLILLDGLDEVPSVNVNNVIDEIENFVDKYDKNRFILSCRTAARTTFKKFTDIEIVEFDDGQIQSFIDHWFSSELDQKNQTAKNCWELLQKKDYKSAKELSHTPLLLTFLCLVYDEDQSFPTNRSRLYHDSLRILLVKWSGKKRLENRGLVYENLSIEQEEILLSEIAYFNFVSRSLLVEKKEIVKQLKDFLMKNFNAPNLDGERVLKTIEIEQGIFVERARNYYAFSHLTLQEYLTAQYIYDNDLIEDVVKKYITDERWKEVFLLISGLMRGKADKLLLAMEKEAHHYLKTSLGKSKLIPILQWADEMTKDSVDSPITPVGRRAIANANAYAHANANVNTNTNVIAIAYAYAIAIANVNAIAYPYAYTNSIAYSYAIAIAYAYAIDRFIELANLFSQDKIFSRVNISQLIADLQALKKVIPNDQARKKERQEFVKKLFKIWQEAFILTPKLLNLSIEELEEIDNHYFYINRLILDCQKVAVNVSPTVWQEIENRMLRVP
jgi:hypothetical protein